MGLKFWLFIQESTPIAIFFFGREPVNLISPPGTPMGMIKILEYKRAKDFINEIFNNFKDLGKKNKVKYILLSNIPIEQNEIVSVLKKQGFEEKASWYRMERQLNEIPNAKGILKLKKVEKKEVREFLTSSEHCTSGSYEGEAMLHLAEIPDTLLNFWYDMQELYYVYKDNEMIGILNLTLSSPSNINNIGVAPEYRSKGHGRQIMLLALNILKEKGIEKAGLRVHVKNIPAKGLYDSLGFKKIDQQTDIIYIK